MAGNPIVHPQLHEPRLDLIIGGQLDSIDDGITGHIGRKTGPQCGKSFLPESAGAKFVAADSNADVAYIPPFPYLPAPPSLALPLRLSAPGNDSIGFHSAWVLPGYTFRELSLCLHADLEGHRGIRKLEKDGLS